MAKKVLIVEDDRFLRSLIADSLKFKKCEVTEVQSGEQAMDIVSELKPDLVILDLLLPGMHGFKFLEWFKAQPEPLSATPVIILSNLGNQDDIDKGFELGAKDYLVKARFTINEINRKINSALA